MIRLPFPGIFRQRLRTTHAMALLDKFNAWYVRSIPETEQGVVIMWREPVAGARYRWSTRRHMHIVWLVVFFLGMLLIPSRRSIDAMPFETRLWIAVGATGALALFQWLYRDSRQVITLTANYLVIGQGRSPQRIQFHDARLTLEERDGHRVLIVTKPECPRGQKRQPVARKPET